jgi:hypothetical protein
MSFKRKIVKSWIFGKKTTEIEIRKVILVVSLFQIFSCSKTADIIPVTTSSIFKLPDTGQTISYTTTPGEDADYTINPPSYTDNGDGTVTDNVTGLIWQKTDGGEMTFESASSYCKNLNLGGFSDWRSPTSIELYSINSLDKINPAINTIYFTKTLAEYWWTNETRSDDANSVWVVNAGGGIGAHPKSETVSSGGMKKFHVRAVRDKNSIIPPALRFTDNGDGTITDNFTGLIWTKIQSSSLLSWEDALVFSEGLTTGGQNDWRLPNIKEIQSLNNTKLSKPSFNKAFFINLSSGNYWSSTTLQNATLKAWDINIDYGIVSYNDKTMKENVLCVRGGN